MNRYQWKLSLRFLGAACLVAVIAAGCRGAERQSSRVLARGASDSAASPTPATSSSDNYYLPPSVDELIVPDTPAEPSEKRSAPPAPVAPVGDDVTWSLENRASGTLKPVSSEVSNAPRLLAPGRARSLREVTAEQFRDAIR